MKTETEMAFIEETHVTHIKVKQKKKRDLSSRRCLEWHILLLLSMAKRF